MEAALGVGDELGQAISMYRIRLVHNDCFSPKRAETLADNLSYLTTHTREQESWCHKPVFQKESVTSRTKTPHLSMTSPVEHNTAMVFVTAINGNCTKDDATTSVCKRGSHAVEHASRADVAPADDTPARSSE